jgi:hypothetical protein
MKAYAGIDLHASNNYTAVIDDHDKRLYGKLCGEFSYVVSV